MRTDERESDGAGVRVCSGSERLSRSTRRLLRLLLCTQRGRGHTVRMHNSPYSAHKIATINSRAACERLAGASSTSKYRNQLNDGMIKLFPCIKAAESVRRITSRRTAAQPQRYGRRCNKVGSRLLERALALFTHSYQFTRRLCFTTLRHTVSVSHTRCNVPRQISVLKRVTALLKRERVSLYTAIL